MSTLVASVQAPAKVPDAVLLPTGCNVGSHSLERALHVHDVAARILAVDGTVGEKAYCFVQHTGEFFCTKDLSDTIAFPKGHRYEGHPRYNWVDGPDGARFGYLVPQAKKPAPVAAEVTHA